MNKEIGRALKPNIKTHAFFYFTSPHRSIKTNQINATIRQKCTLIKPTSWFQGRPTHLF